MRLFFASPLSSESRRFLTLQTHALLNLSEGLLRAVPDGSQHFTHVFLGECARTTAELREALRPIERQPRPRVSIGGAHVFSGRKRPRLVCLEALENSYALAELSEAIRLRLLPLLPDLDDYRIKKPHVTLARFGRRARIRDATRVEDLLAGGELAAWTRKETLSSVELVRSELSHQGARYETLATIPLGGISA